MKSIFHTCVLFLVLPWGLTGEVTFMSNYTRQQEDAPNYHETTIRGDELTTSSTKNTENSRLHEASAKHETTMWNNVPTSFSVKNQDEYINVESKTVLSLKSPPQTTESYVTSKSHGEHLTHAVTISTEESKSSSHLFSLPFWTEMMQKKTDRITIKATVLNISKEVTTNKNDHQTVHHFNSTNKDLDRHTQADKTTKSAENYTTAQTFTVNSTQFQSSPGDITNQSEVQTTKWYSVPQEKETTHTPTLTIINGTLNINNEGRNDTATYPFNALTTTGLSTGLSSAVDTTVGTTSTTDTTNTTIKDHVSERNHPEPTSESTSTTQKVNIKTSIPKSFNKKIHPGHIVASLIGTILILMLVAFVAIWVKKHHKKKKLTNDPDWAGPSPFIEADMHPNLTINDGRSFHRQEPKRISLYSFLPQQFSKRHSLLNSTDEGVPLEDTQAGNTFGQCNTQPLNGKATADQIQNHETNSPPGEVPSDSNAQETISNPPALENNEDAQKTPKLDDEIIPPAEISNTNTTPFEDVDLNLSLDKDTESTSSDAINDPPPSQS